MKLDQSHIGKRFIVKERYGACVLLALSGDRQTAFMDTEPGSPHKTQGRYEALPASSVVRKFGQKVQEERAA